MALRFKANKVKLEERAKQHKHNRDITEENINRELTDLHQLLKVHKSCWWHAVCGLVICVSHDVQSSSKFWLKIHFIEDIIVINIS